MQSYGKPKKTLVSIQENTLSDGVKLKDLYSELTAKEKEPFKDTNANSVIPHSLWQPNTSIRDQSKNIWLNNTLRPNQVIEI